MTNCRPGWRAASSIARFGKTAQKESPCARWIRMPDRGSLWLLPSGPDQIRNISSPEPIERARRAGDILPHFGCTSRESFFPQQRRDENRRDEKGIAAQRVGDTCTRVLGVATRRTRSDASTAPSPCAKPYFASTAAMRSQASINTERGLGTHMRWKNSPPSGSKLRPSCKMTFASS